MLLRTDNVTITSCTFESCTADRVSAAPASMIGAAKPLVPYAVLRLVCCSAPRPTSTPPPAVHSTLGVLACKKRSM